MGSSANSRIRCPPGTVRKETNFRARSSRAVGQQEWLGTASAGCFTTAERTGTWRSQQHPCVEWPKQACCATRSLFNSTWSTGFPAEYPVTQCESLEEMQQRLGIA